MRDEGGQAGVEFVALVLMCCLALGALLALRGGFDGRDVGGFLAGHLVCAVTAAAIATRRGWWPPTGSAARRPCARSLRTSRTSAGERELPVDWRDCRQVSCSVAPDNPGLDAHVPAGRGRSRASAFTHLVRRDGHLYIQYWLYYPDSNTTLAGSDRLSAHLSGRASPGYPGFHRDSGGSVRPRGSRRQRLAPGQLARALPELQMGVLPWRVGAAHRLGAGLTRQPFRTRAVRAGAALAPRRAHRRRRPATGLGPPGRGSLRSGRGAAGSESGAPPERAFGSSRSSRSTRGCTRHSIPVSSRRGTRTPTATRRPDTREGQNRPLRARVE